jgi:SAM-dependent methyltransferase
MNVERTRADWWDDAFTQLLLSAIPPDAATLIDVGCGLCTAAHELLPVRTKMAYLGVDLDEERLATAQKTFEGAAYARRVTLRKAPAHELPVPEAVAEVVLFALTLQEIADIPRALKEARRALVPGGRVVAVEPDNLGLRFGFDGPLDEESRAFAELCRSEQMSLGPSLPRLLADAGLKPTVFRAHVLATTREETAADLAARLAGLAEMVCPDAAQRARFDSLVEKLAKRPGRGWSSHLVPCFLTVGHRPEFP